MLPERDLILFQDHHDFVVHICAHMCTSFKQMFTWLRLMTDVCSRAFQRFVKLLRSKRRRFQGIHRQGQEDVEAQIQAEHDARIAAEEATQGCSTPPPGPAVRKLVIWI